MDLIDSDGYPMENSKLPGEGAGKAHVTFPKERAEIALWCKACKTHEDEAAREDDADNCKHEEPPSLTRASLEPATLGATAHRRSESLLLEHCTPFTP